MTMELLISFLIGVVLQGFFINGAHEAMRGKDLKTQEGAISQGNILYPLQKFFKRIIKNEYWHNPLFACVKCMASVWGFISYWPTVLMMYGFHWQQIPVFVFDVFILTSVNYYIYKKL